MSLAKTLINLRVKDGDSLKNKYEIRGDITAIFLNRRDGSQIETLIDTEDLKRANEFPNTWCANWKQSTQSFYCRGTIYLPGGVSVRINMHRWLTNCPKNMLVDHFDNKTLNNRRKNLRIVTHKENNQNRAKANRDSSTRILNVSWYPKKQKWRVTAKIRGRTKHFGYYQDVEEAKKVAQETRSKFMPGSKEATVLHAYS
jgi:hypothetical protein